MKRFTRKEFLEALFNEYFKKRDGFILARTVRHFDKKVSTRYFPNIEILAKEQYQDDQNIFFGVCPRENMKPERAYIRYLTALWAGLDFGSEGYSGKNVYFSSTSQAAKAVRSFPLPPSIIVESGRGMHLYWLLNEVTFVASPQLVEALLRKISDYFQCQTEVPIDSCLRLPGTINCKMPGQRLSCEVKFVNTDFRYDLAEFQELNFMELTSHAARSDNHKGEPAATAPDNRSSDEAVIADEDVEDLSSEFEDLLASEEAKPRPLPIEDEIQVSAANTEISIRSSNTTNTRVSREFEPVPYEGFSRTAETNGSTQRNSTSQLSEDRIAEKVAERIAEKFMDELADRIVDKLAKKLMSPGA